MRPGHLVAGVQARLWHLGTACTRPGCLGVTHASTATTVVCSVDSLTILDQQATAEKRYLSPLWSQISYHTGPHDFPPLHMSEGKKTAYDKCEKKIQNVVCIFRERVHFVRRLGIALSTYFGSMKKGRRK